MTTNYGERPGLTVDGDREYWRGKVAEVERERDAARADAARLRAALERIEAYLAPMPAEGNMAAAVAFGMVHAAIRRGDS